MSKAATKALIDANITANGTQAITGPILNNVLNTMVDDYGTQEELSQLSQDVIDLTTWDTGETETINAVDLYTESGFVNGSTGAIAANNTLRRTDFIPLDDVVKIVTLTPSGSSAGFAFYSDRDVSTFISGGTNPGKGNGTYENVPPTGAKYFRTTTKVSDIEGGTAILNITKKVKETLDEFHTNTVNELQDIDSRFVEAKAAILDSTIAGYYPRIDLKRLFSNASFNTQVYDLDGVSAVIVNCSGVNTTYYGIAFSDNNTTFNSSSDWVRYPGTGTYSGSFKIAVPAGKRYMAIDKATTISVISYIYDADIIPKQQGEINILNSMFVSGYYGKTGIYVGDSISTANLYHWKGFMLSKFNVNYVRDSGTYIHPADGGISVIPPVSEPSSQTQKSIWYRCAGDRLGNYDFDFISLFGGTNDMNVLVDSDLSLGAVSDTPYVDTLTGFSDEKAATLTATRPSTLTFASALMGCIEMLHRDFPDKPIYLVTVMPCKSNGYGNTLDANGVRLSERMAILQMQIAAKYNGEISTYASLCSYGVTAVPFYWKVRTYEAASSNALSIDGVHPNVPCGRIMADYFAQILNLR